MRKSGCNKIYISCTLERGHLGILGIQGIDYNPLQKKIGAITINKSQGETLHLGLSVEITEAYSPWDEGQIVVFLSRTIILKKQLL